MRLAGYLLAEKTRRGDILAAFAARDSIRTRRDAVDYDDVLGLRLRAGLTAYDARYLWRARQYKAELVTLDKRVAAAFFRKLGVEAPKRMLRFSNNTYLR